LETAKTATAEAPVTTYTARGSTAFLKISAGVFLAGFSAFSLLFCVQPLLPLFADDFGVSPAESALALSLTAGVLAFAVVAAGAVAVGFQRRTLMFASMLTASLLTIAQAFVPQWHGLLLLRALEGVALAGVPPVILAYLAEEIEPRGLGFSVGLYVAGNGIGGMVGRIGASLLADAYSWRTAMGLLGGLTLAFSIVFIFLMPRSRNFTPHRGASLGYHWAAWKGHAMRPALQRLAILGFIAMGAFVCVYNYAAFRLAAPPYALPQSRIGLIFIVYIFGVIASPIAGAAADRYGRRPVLTAGLVIMAVGVAVTMARPISAIVAGITILTIGFFTAQPVLSSWVGPIAPNTRGHATSLYLLTWYSGAAWVGIWGGYALGAGGWNGLAAMVFALLALGLLAAWSPGSGLGPHTADKHLIGR
jgi:YNFM family putative membrane transporter